MSHPVAVLISVVAVATALSLAGCGSGSGTSTDPGSSTTTPAALDRAALGTRADAICRRVFARQVALLGTISVSDPSTMTRAMTKVHALWEGMAADVAALKPDAQTTAQWDAFVAAVRKEADLYGRSEAAIRAGDAAGNAELLTPLQANTKALVAAAADVGAAACTAPAG